MSKVKQTLFNIVLVSSLCFILPFTIFACFGNSGGSTPPPNNPLPPPTDIPPNNWEVCVPPDKVFDCAHKPPGQDWQYIPPQANPVDPPVDPPPSSDNLCHAPDAHGDFWGSKIDNVQSTITRDAVRDAKLELGNRCGHDPVETLALLAGILRSWGFCSSGPWDDALVIGAPGNLWEEYHVVPFHPIGHEFYGCYTQNMYKGSWPLTGHVPNWPESSTCGVPVPPNGESEQRFKIGPHNNGLNATYLVYGEAFCAAIGFTDNRQWCPVRLEGNPQRSACEAKAYGNPFWKDILGGDNCREGDNPHLVKCRNGVLPSSATICSEDGYLCETWSKN